MRERSNPIAIVAFIVLIGTLIPFTVLMHETNKKNKELNEAIVYLKDNESELYKDIENTLNNSKDDYKGKELDNEKTVEILLETSGDNTEFNKKLSNYLSNVDGKLVSINGQKIVREGLRNYTMWLTNPSMGILPIKGPDSVENKTTYLVKLPITAKYKNYLQDLLENDYRSLVNDIKLGKKLNKKTTNKEGASD